MLLPISSIRVHDSTATDDGVVDAIVLQVLQCMRVSISVLAANKHFVFF